MTLSIVPRPDIVTALDATFRLDGSTTVLAGDGCEAIARLLQGSLRPATGFTFAAAERDVVANVIRLDLDSRLPASGYEIRIDDHGVTLSGGDPAGLFHATQTLLQLCPVSVFRRTVVANEVWELPGVEIVDQPRFAWRGMLLDVSRHFFGRDSVLRLIDALALHRFNVLHLHLTDDQGWRIQIERYPRLTDVGSRRPRSATAYNDPAHPDDAQYDDVVHDGFFTHDDIREIVAYAAERHITVVPEIDLPGHSQAALAAYPELGNEAEHLPVWADWGVNPHVLNVNEATIEFYQNVFSEVFSLFPSQYIHIGGDECPKDEWRTSSSAQERMRSLGLPDEDALQAWLVGRFAEYFGEHGRRLIGWDEILEGGLAAETTVMSWRGEAGGIAAANAGHDVIMTPESHTYFYRRQSADPTAEPRGAEPPLPLRHVFDYEPLPAELSFQARTHVLGAQCSMWTEHVVSERQMHQMAFPRVSAFAEVVWCRDRGSFEDFEARLDRHHNRLHAMGIDAFRPGPVTAR